MKSTVILLAMCMICAFCLIGCGGGGNSSTTETSSTMSSPQYPPSEQFSSIEINPLVDLGLVAGDEVCFRVKSYDNYSESAFSEAVCGQIENELSFTLSWDKVAKNINGYYVYFGTDINNANNFLADVIES